MMRQKQLLLFGLATVLTVALFFEIFDTPSISTFELRREVVHHDTVAKTDNKDFAKEVKNEEVFGDDGNDNRDDGCVDCFNFTEALPAKPVKTRPVKVYDKAICNYFDFAITGFAKCGTTSLRSWFYAHNDTRMPIVEEIFNHVNPLNGATHIQNIIAKSGSGKFRGYENPHDIQWAGSVNLFRYSCPNTKLIVSLRHPVTWFESFYNYGVIYNDYWRIGAGTPNEQINPLPSTKPIYVTSGNGAFHRFLAVLGKTPRGDDEVELLNPASFTDIDKELLNIDRVNNTIFLLEVSQMSDTNETHAATFKQDIEKFIGFDEPLPAIPHANSGEAAQKKRKRNVNTERLMDICDPIYKPIHDEMMIIARNASAWILGYFVQSADVVISGNFEDVVKGWNEDPCDTRRNEEVQNQKEVLLQEDSSSRS